MTDEIPDAPSDTVILNVTPEGVAMVTLNRPEVHNAFNIELVQRLSERFLDDLEDQDGIRIVLIDGAGPSFSAGGDLKEMQRADGQSESEMRGDFADFATMLLRLRGLPQPTVALVHGSAIAGGLGLVAACDIAIATADAAFALSEVRLGIIPAMIAPMWSKPWAPARRGATC